MLLPVVGHAQVVLLPGVQVQEPVPPAALLAFHSSVWGGRRDGAFGGRGLGFAWVHERPEPVRSLGMRLAADQALRRQFGEEPAELSVVHAQPGRSQQFFRRGRAPSGQGGEDPLLALLPGNRVDE